MKPTVTVSLQEYQSMKESISKSEYEILRLTQQIKKYTNGVTSEKTVYLRIDSYNYSANTRRENHSKIYFTDKAEADKALLEKCQFLLEENITHRESVRVAEQEITTLKLQIERLKNKLTEKPWYKRIF